MAIFLDAKKAMVQDMASLAETSVSMLLVDYSGLTVTEMTALRVQAREQGVYLKVIRNRLAQRAFKDSRFESLLPALKGPTLLACSFEAPSVAARVLKAFIKDHPSVNVKMMSLGNGNLGPEKLDFVASMPTREEGLAQIAMMLQAPVRSLALSAKDVPARLVRVLAALSDARASA